MQYAPFPWQQSLWDRLLQAKQQQRLPHALLISGTSHCGQLELAQELAKLLCCAHPQAPCQRCDVCHWISIHHHPDVKLLAHKSDQQAIKVDDIRELCVDLQQKSQHGGYRVAIISPAHAMNRSASNALLKTLEEPGENSVLILISNKMDLLPATILSRVQIFHQLTPTLAEAQAWLEKNYPEQLHTTLALLPYVQGSLFLALEYAKAGLEETVKNFQRHLIHLAQGDHNQWGKWPKLQDLFTLDCVLNLLQQWVSVLIRFKLKIKPTTSPNDQQFCGACAAVKLDYLYRFYDELLRINGALKQQVHLNEDLLLEHLMLNWMQCFEGNSHVNS
ncbi:MAG: hypothetical protein KIT27_10065 [Legionellales bacterium]|nr:hypothetical protein [Legionellales bacterium]